MVLVGQPSAAPLALYKHKTNNDTETYHLITQGKLYTPHNRITYVLYRQVKSVNVIQSISDSIKLSRETMQ